MGQHRALSSNMQSKGVPCLEWSARQWATKHLWRPLTTHPPDERRLGRFIRWTRRNPRHLITKLANCIHHFSNFSSERCSVVVYPSCVRLLKPLVAQLCLPPPYRRKLNLLLLFRRHHKHPTIQLHGLRTSNRGPQLVQDLVSNRLSWSYSQIRYPRWSLSQTNP
jgi:hypothetical protein